MSVHTPGPWSAGIQYDAPDPDSLLHQCPVWAGGGETSAVAEARGRTPEECAANALLVAAAPGLLAVAEEIAGDSQVDLVDSERRIRLYAAIVKARGELPWIARVGPHR